MAASGWRLDTLLNILARTAPRAENYVAHSVGSATVRKPDSRQQGAIPD